MEKRTYTTKEEILQRGREAIGIPMKEIDKKGRLSSAKGAIGHILEESWFGYDINSKAEADFSDAGVELKVTPYVRTNKGIRAKERLVCSIINYQEEYKKTFYTSSFWEKSEIILIMSYEHKYDVLKGDYTIDEAVLFSYPISDLIIIKQDWEKIIQKIKDGKAHEISEGDTLYLAACTKGTTAAKSLRSQPYSNIKAKQRAYSLKQSYMTTILQKFIYGVDKDEHIIKDPHMLSENTFEEYFMSKVRPYLGRTQEYLKDEFKITSCAKNINEIILSAMLGIKGKIANTDEFKKASIIPKTIRIENDGRIKESMSFPTFNFIKLASENWEESEFKSYIEQSKFLFVIFRNNDSGELIFDNILFWNIPSKDLEEVEKVWKKTVQTLNEGVILEYKNGRIHNNLPKSSENPVAHVRPHAKDSSDTLPLPDGRHMPKQCFWLNNTYIEKQINKVLIDTTND